MTLNTRGIFLMNVVEIVERFPHQEACMSHLEKVRWGDTVVCPRCESENVKRRNESQRGRIGRWNCYDCQTTFKATDGPIFHGTKTPLQKWCLAITLMANAKKSLSSFQLGRDIGLPQKTCWRIMMAIRAEMAKNNPVLEGIVEADETYIGGKNKKSYDKETGKAKAGRGTAKDIVLGAVARGGQVVAELVENAKSEVVLEALLGESSQAELCRRHNRLKHRFIYVALLMDVFTRMIRAWNLSQHLTQSLPLQPLEQALDDRVPEIHHSDQGVQSLSSAYLSRLKAHGIEISVARRGCPWENGYAERLIRTLKEEEVHLNDYQDIHEARERIGHFITQGSHQKRPHSALAYLTPIEFQRQNLS